MAEKNLRYVSQNVCGLHQVVKLKKQFQTLSKPEFSPTSREILSDFTFNFFSGIRKLADAFTETTLFQTRIGYQNFVDEKTVARTY